MRHHACVASCYGLTTWGAAAAGADRGEACLARAAWCTSLLPPCSAIALDASDPGVTAVVKQLGLGLWECMSCCYCVKVAVSVFSHDKPFSTGQMGVTSSPNLPVALPWLAQ